MRFWRFDFESDSMVDACISESTILATTRVPRTAKRKPSEVINNQLEVGDGLLLASFDLMKDNGNVVAIGVVTGKEKKTSHLTITWERVKFTLSPNPQGGIAQWKKEACFKFADDPARRYGLESRFRKVFGDILDV